MQHDSWFYCTDFNLDFNVSLNQYSIWTIHDAKFCRFFKMWHIHFIAFKSQQKKKPTDKHGLMQFREQLYRTLCDSLAMQWNLDSFYFFTSWMTSSSSITWSLPTFWGLCFTDAPHTRALKEWKCLNEIIVHEGITEAVKQDASIHHLKNVKKKTKTSERVL